MASTTPERICNTEFTDLKTSDFIYDLPEELIAQTPSERRDGSRLLALDRRTGAIEHRHFYDLPEYLRPGDCLVLNDSRVIPARLFGTRPSGGAVEVVLLRELGEGRWECLSRPGKKMRVGTEVRFGDGELTGVVEEVRADGNRVIRFQFEGIFLEILDRLGSMPLPPYIKTQLADPERYQTVYAREPGSAAAPTAGLHFTPELLERIRAMGVDVRFVTLHVGLGTFRPVKAENVEEHEMHSEFCTVPEDTAEAIARTKASGGRVVAVGTTTCRTLESFAAEDGVVRAGSRWTSIFIYPGYAFRCVDALVTNFHLPGSTLVMLVSAFAGRENILHAYETAVAERYRFFSFGDAMFIGDVPNGR